MKTLRIQLYVNNMPTLDLDPYLTYAYQYYKKHGVILNFDIAQTAVSGYVSINENLAGGGKGYVLEGATSLVATTNDHDATMFNFNLMEWKAPWYSQYPLSSDAPVRSSTVMYQGKPFVNMGFYTKTAQDIENTKVTFIHEIMHVLCKISGVYDQMDTYYKNYDPDAPDGNFATQWRLLEPWLNPVAQVQQSTIDLICGFEGFSAKPYRDVAGNWTIGYGFTTWNGVPVTAKTAAITVAQGQEQLKKQIQTYGTSVSWLTSGKLNQHQFDACVSLAYNIGTKAFSTSTVLAQINKKNMQAAADAFLLWNKAGGKVIQGLKNRRQKERTVFLS